MAISNNHQGNGPLVVCAVGAYTAQMHARTACLAEKGHDVHLITPVPSGRDYKVVEWTPRLSARSVRTPVQIIREIYNFRKILRSINPHIIHIHYACGLYAALACIFKPCPIIVTVMGGDVLHDEQPLPLKMLRFLVREILSSADGITAKSNYLIERIKANGPQNKPLERVFWGVHPNFRPDRDTLELRRKLQLPSGAKVVLSPKLLQPFYNIESIIEALAIICRKRKDLVLLICEMCADPAYQKRLRQLIAAGGLEDNVRFVGSINPDDMPDYYNLADVVVSIPQSDGLPQSLFEAMACGVPNIIGRLARYGEVVEEDEHVLMVDCDDKRELAQKIERLLSDPGHRKYIAQNALLRVRQLLDYDRETARVVALYRQVMSEGKAQKKKWSGAKITAILGINYAQYFLLDIKARLLAQEKPRPL